MSDVLRHLPGRVAEEERPVENFFNRKSTLVRNPCITKSLMEGEFGPDDDEGTPTGEAPLCSACGESPRKAGSDLCQTCMTLMGDDEKEESAEDGAARRKAALDRLHRPGIGGKEREYKAGNDSPTWDDTFNKESAEDFMDKKFKDCTEDTTSGDIATVPMGFKGLCPQCKGAGCSSCGGFGRTKSEAVNRSSRKLFYEVGYQPKTGERCSCKPGIERDNCPSCEGTGQKIDFNKIRQQNRPKPDERIPVKIVWNKESVRKIVNQLLNEGVEWSTDKADSYGAECPKCGGTIMTLKKRGMEGDLFCHGCHAVTPVIFAVSPSPNDSTPTMAFTSIDLKRSKLENKHSASKPLTEEIDQSLLDRLSHYKDDIPHLIGTIEGIASSNSPADSEELYDEIAEVVNLLAKADHLLATLVTSKNLRTPKQELDDDDEKDDEKDTLEKKPNAGYPMDQPDETKA